MSKRDKWTPERREHEQALKRARLKERRRTDPAYRERENAYQRARRAGKPPRGPMGDPPAPMLAEGLELAGQSIQHDGEGKVSLVWDLGRRAGDSDPAPIPPDFAITRIAQATRNGDEVLRWATYAREEADRHAALMAAYERHASNYAGLVPAAPLPEVTDTDLMTIYPIGDHHLGMLSWAPETGESWDLRHGKASLVAVMSELVRMAPNSERAIISNLGDFLHAQDDANVTPGHGNKLDVDGRHAKVADAALALLTTCIDLALRKHRHVTVRNLPGNHDPRVAAGLARELRAWYRDEPRLDVADAYAVHQYDRFGNVLLGWHHGDRTPGKELVAVMSVDRRVEWGECKFCFWHCGHVHHKIGDKEHPGAIVEAHRILPPGDAYHAGRYRASRGMQAITYHRVFGETSRAVVGIDRVREEMKKLMGAA